MKKFEFYEIQFEKIKEVIYVATEELHFEYNFALNAYCLFKNSKGEDCQLDIPYRQAITKNEVKKMEIFQQKQVIKNTVITYFEKKYGKGFDKKMNQPYFNYIDDISQFNPHGFEDSTYDEICETIHSIELVDRFQKMKGAS